MKFRTIVFLAGLGIFLCLGTFATAQAFLDLEGGTAFTGYNDLAIPAKTVPRISLKTDIVSSPALSLRVRLGYTIGSRHTFSVLIAPLSVYGSSTLDSDITYQGKTFAKGSRVQSIYRFDSYRFTYRYSIIDTDQLLLALGITGKIRSADIAIMSDTGYAHRSDLGVVPLVNFAVRWNFATPFSVLLDADALASPYGRAEDVLLALQYNSSDKVSWRLGYRMLEGGAAGGGNVYTFALFNYAMAGVHITFDTF